MSEDGERAERESRSTVSICAREKAVPLWDVRVGETVLFEASGRWTDLWINCGPSGYRAFPFDILDIRPRCERSNWFCLMGQVQGSGGEALETFPIGDGCIHRFAHFGTLVVFANDRDDKYGNNKGTISLTTTRGVDLPSAGEGRAATGLFGVWQHLQGLARKTAGIPFATGLTALVCAVLALVPQGIDVVRSVSSDGDAARLLLFTGLLLLLAVQCWLWPRLVVVSNYTEDRTNWSPRWLLTWVPRLLGILPFVAVIAAAFQDPAVSWIFIGVQLVAGASFLVFVVARNDVIERVARRGGGARDYKPALRRMSRRWAIGSFVLSGVMLLVTSLFPAHVGLFLGAPGSVFLAIGLIIPVMVTFTQTGRGIGLPVATALLAWAGLISFWNDAHGVGRRALSVDHATFSTRGERFDLRTAYKRWRETAPVVDGSPRLVLIASEGGASRAGHWTGQVLATLHDRAKGRLAPATFAINSVSGGSVGAVGYAALLQSAGVGTSGFPGRLATLTGGDALGPVLAGAFFPDLVQRFLPVPLLPDRAQALEGAWETHWNAQCSRDEPDCRGLLGRPFLSLGPVGNVWRPLPIVQGASEETGRRILTSRLQLTREEVDSDDFYELVGGDVAVSTAIHNGARFPWVSPAGRLVNRNATGHIIDGGYFDASGIEVVRELAEAILRGPAREQGDATLKIMIVFAGYRGATAEEGGVAEPRADPSFLNEIRAPLAGLIASRTAHGASLLRRLRIWLPGVAEARAAGDAGAALKAEDVDFYEPSPDRPGRAVSYVPVVLCDLEIDGNRVVPPMDWALSEKVKRAMNEAVLPNGSCSKPHHRWHKAERIRQIVPFLGVW